MRLRRPCFLAVVAEHVGLSVQAMQREEESDALIPRQGVAFVVIDHRREEGWGASKVTAGRAQSIRKQASRRGDSGRFSCCRRNCASFSGLYEPSYTMP